MSSLASVVMKLPCKVFSWPTQFIFWALLYQQPSMLTNRDHLRSGSIHGSLSSSQPLTPWKLFPWTERVCHAIHFARLQSLVVENVLLHLSSACSSSRTLKSSFYVHTGGLKIHMRKRSTCSSTSPRHKVGSELGQAKISEHSYPSNAECKKLWCLGENKARE